MPRQQANAPYIANKLEIGNRNAETKKNISTMLANFGKERLSATKKRKRVLVG